jgi:hypothetical protein
MEGLSIIGELFEIERTCRALRLAADDFTRERRERAEPVLHMLDKWVWLNCERVDPRGRLDSAIGYYINQRDALRRFLEDGRLRLDNNLSEQQLRHVKVGEHNWMFFANETGIKWYSTFRSLIASCALHGLNCQLYLEQMLRLVPHWPRNRVLELAPKYWTRTVDNLDSHHQQIIGRPWESTPAPSCLMTSPRPATERTVDVSCAPVAEAS